MQGEPVGIGVGVREVYKQRILWRRSHDRCVVRGDSRPIPEGVFLKEIDVPSYPAMDMNGALRFLVAELAVQKLVLLFDVSQLGVTQVEYN